MQPDSARRRRGQKDLTKRKTCLAMAPQIVLVVPACALNGESPGWNPFFKKLFWVDIRGPALHAFDPATGKDECWEMGLDRLPGAYPVRRCGRLTDRAL